MPVTNTWRLIILAGLLLIVTGCSTKDAGYTSPEALWPESFGNHRAVLKIDNEALVVKTEILWRRHDPSPENKRFLVINSLTGDTIRNIYRYEVSNELCRIAFGPVEKPGIYHFYYLPFEVQEGWGFYGRDYLKPEKEPDPEWIKYNRINEDPGSFQEAELIEFQSRTAFDSFYPMEVIALDKEKEEMFAEFTGDYLLFPEDRSFPIRMKDEIPYKWARRGPSGRFYGVAQRNEYYAFQIGVFAGKKELKNVKISFADLNGSRERIPSSSLTCFNTGGTDPYGNSFEKQVDVKSGNVQPLWIGVDIPEDITPGKYRGQVKVSPENSEPQTVDVVIKIKNKVITGRGDNEPWRHSRL